MSKDKHSEIMHELGVISGELNGINKALEKINGSVKVNTDDISSIKVSRAKQTGIVIGVSSVVSIVWAFISNKLNL
jgi:copper chaperone CopZ|tara:strand:- start:1811 stop:2038 length:228 start_codon:yes stop_codon:yes gene_type:complete